MIYLVDEINFYLDSMLFIIKMCGNAPEFCQQQNNKTNFENRLNDVSIELKLLIFICQYIK